MCWDMDRVINAIDLYCGRRIVWISSVYFYYNAKFVYNQQASVLLKEEFCVGSTFQKRNFLVHFFFFNFKNRLGKYWISWETCSVLISLYKLSESNWKCIFQVCDWYDRACSAVYFDTRWFIENFKMAPWRCHYTSMSRQCCCHTSLLPRRSCSRVS